MQPGSRAKRMEAFLDQFQSPASEVEEGKKVGASEDKPHWPAEDLDGNEGVKSS